MWNLRKAKTQINESQAQIIKVKPTSLRKRIRRAKPIIVPKNKEYWA
jgi:hypothetical protein